MSPSSYKKGLVFVALSGGVDSSVAAYLLLKEGYEVVGAHIRSYNVDGCAEGDAEDARRVAEHLRIPFYVFDFEHEYKQRVLDYMISEYRLGRTPNPDVMCNKEIKFGLFYEKARALGADFVATGHYVRLRSRRARQKIVYGLYQAKDENKDQTYFLWMLDSQQLAHCLFPIGAYLKSEVRALARSVGIPTAEKKDSQGICFLGQFSLQDFLKEHIPEKEGSVVTTHGNVIGKHCGAFYYTIGQRHGLGLGIKNKELGVSGQDETKAHYVVEKNILTNTIVVAEGEDNPALFCSWVQLKNLNFFCAPQFSIFGLVCRMRVHARIRYRQPLFRAWLEKLSASQFTLVFDMPQKYVASGQSAVFYRDNGELIGGGVIE